MKHQETAIETAQLTHAYGGRVLALREVDLRILNGEFVAIIGQNGSGKTTLAKHFNGLLKPTSGQVTVHGVETRRASVTDLARKVGYVFQNPDHQLCMRTVEEELRFGPRNLGTPEDEISARVEKVLTTFDLKQYMDSHPFLLAKADRLRVAFCSVLTMEPETIVVDEPTTGQDMRQCYEVMNVLKDLNGKGRTIVIITHNMRLVAEYAMRTIVMKQGQIIMDAPTAEVFSQPAMLAETYLSPPQITQLGQRLASYGIPLGVLSVSEMHEILSRMATGRSVNR